MKTLYVVTTEQCQMNCPFCYTQFVPQFNQDFHKDAICAEMVAEVINKGIDGEQFTYVIFHGGEPLLVPDTILEIMDKVKVRTEFSVQSNLAYKELNKKQLEVLVRLKSYGTSYNVDRFENNKIFKEYFENNVRELNSMGLDSTVLITVTQDQIDKQNPWALYEYIKNLGIKKVVFERPIFPMEEIKKNKEKYTYFYEKVDEYLKQCASIFPPDMTNLFWLVEKALEHGLTLYDTHCSNNTYTLFKNKIKYGCPSLENRNESNRDMIGKCLQCDYYKYCGMDCECFNHVCAFPKKTFDYIKKQLENKK